MSDHPTIKRAEAYGFRLSIDTSLTMGYSERYGRLTLSIMPRDESPYGLTDDFQKDAKGQYGYPEPLQRLEVSCLFQPADLQKPDSWDSTIPYGWTLAYRDLYSVELPECERMTALLRRVTRGLEKIEKTAGRADNFGAYAQRIGTLLGVCGIYAESPKFNWYWSQPDRIEDVVNSAIARWHREQSPEAAEVTA